MTALTLFAPPDAPTIGGDRVIWEETAVGADRLTRLGAAVRNAPGPAVVGFAYGDLQPSGPWSAFPAAAARVASGDALLPAVEVRPTERHPVDLDGFEARVTSTVATLQDHGGLEKVVLAAQVEVPITMALPAILGRVWADTGAHRFAWEAGGAVFVGASPELLVSVRGGRLRLAPLAGTLTTAQPQSTAKLEKEHDLTIADLVERLSDVASGIEVAGPHTVAAGPVEHLRSTITGLTDAGVLEVAAAIHPTPAIAGVPRDAAQAWIHDTEDFERGWYGGGIGHVDPTGDGVIALGIRCALLGQERALLYAGAGIVTESEPAAELEETLAKMEPMARALELSLARRAVAPPS